MKLVNLIGIFLLASAQACTVNVDAENNGNGNGVGAGGSKSSGDNGEFGACGAFSIVGTYEGGLKITADCEIQYGEHALVFQEYAAEVQVDDHTFRTIQLFEVDNTRTLDSGWCRAQLHNNELYLDCPGLSFRGLKQGL